MGADMGGPSGTSSLMTIQSLVRVFIGVGVLSLSHEVKEAGILAYSSLLVVLAYIALWCILRLSEACDLIMHAEARRNMLRRKYSEKRRALGASPTVDELNQIELFEDMGQYSDADIEQVDRAGILLPTMTEVGINAFGYWGGVITDASVIITQIGACTAYTIFISGTMADVTGIDRKIWIAMLWIPQILLSFIRDMAKLAIFSSLANIVYVYTLAVIFYQGYTQRCCIEYKDAKLFNYTHLPIVFGSLSFALEGIALVLPIRNRMKEPNNFKLAMSIGLIVIAFLYFSVANIGYLFYGEDTLSPLVKNLTPGILTNTVKISLSIVIFISYAMAIFPISHFNDGILDERFYKLNFAKLRIQREAEEAQLALEQHQQREKNRTSGGDDDADNKNNSNGINEEGIEVDNNNEEKKSKITNEDLVPEELRLKRFFIQNVHRVVFVTFICTIALLLPSFELVVALFGAFSNALLAYILPALFWVRVCTPQIFTGEIWYPYDRDGTKTSPQNGSLLKQEIDINYLSTSDTNTTTSPTNGVANNGIKSTNENDPLVLNTAIVSDDDSIQHKRKKQQELGWCSKFSYLLFPYTVAVVGSLASVVAVVLAVQKLIQEMFP